MSRIYTIDGTEFPSVTTILEILDKSDALIPWAVRCAVEYVRENMSDESDLESVLQKAVFEWRSVKDKAADIGTQIHDAIEQWIKYGTKLTSHPSPNVMQGFAAFLQWEKEHSVKWLHSESKIVNHDRGYAGTLDAICEYEGRKMVIDFKSSKGFYDTFGMQIAAYKFAAEAMGHPTDGCGILRLDKTTGLPEFKDYTKRYPQDLAAFLSLLGFYYTYKKRRLQNNQFAVMAHTK